MERIARVAAIAELILIPVAAGAAWADGRSAAHADASVSDASGAVPNRMVVLYRAWPDKVAAASCYARHQRRVIDEIPQLGVQVVDLLSQELNYLRHHTRQKHWQI